MRGTSRRLSPARRQSVCSAPRELLCISRMNRARPSTSCVKMRFSISAIFSSAPRIFSSYSFSSGSDVALGVDECLFPDPFGRHLILVGVAHFDIVPEHVVETYFERRYSGGGALSPGCSAEHRGRVRGARGVRRVPGRLLRREPDFCQAGWGRRDARCARWCPQGPNSLPSTRQWRAIPASHSLQAHAARPPHACSESCSWRVSRGPIRRAPTFITNRSSSPTSLQNFIRPLARGGIAEKSIPPSYDDAVFPQDRATGKESVVEPPRPIGVEV